jgi:superfamily II DNA or RNA helicase
MDTDSEGWATANPSFNAGGWLPPSRKWKIVPGPHYVCPRIGLTATPKIAVPADGREVAPEDLAINDTYRLFGCESSKPDYEFGLTRGIDEGFLAPYRKEEHITALTKEAMGTGVLYDHLLDPETRKRIDLPQEEQIEPNLHALDWQLRAD